MANSGPANLDNHSAMKALSPSNLRATGTIGMMISRLSPLLLLLLFTQGPCNRAVYTERPQVTTKNLLYWYLDPLGLVVSHC